MLVDTASDASPSLEGGERGPTAYARSRARDIASTFRMLVSPAVETIVLEMTNLEGSRKYGDDWKRMDATDLRAYVRLLILAGVYRSRGEAAASLWDAESGRVIFPATMPLKRFHAYSRLLRFDDRETRAERRATDKLAAVREVWDAWAERLPLLYDPGPEVTVRGRNVTCDNFFTSYELARLLLLRDNTVVGTVRKNRREIPPALLSSKRRDVFSSKFAFTPNVTLVSYLAKKSKNVLLLSTRHAAGDVSDRADAKPVIVLDYNRNKGGVDNLDKVTGTYSCRRMTARWRLVVFHNILDVSAYNAFVIWREVNPDWMPGKRNKRRVFLERLGKALVAPFVERRERLPRTEASAAFVKAARRARAHRDGPEDPDGVAAAETEVVPRGAASNRKRCQICPSKKDSKTYTVCNGCNKYICKGCSLALPFCPTCARDDPARFSAPANLP
ncbi:uncharacterized protein LOC117728888 [Cyclopterus lumpus]|uniref:uncharacterized protein LOC117728888 n=1 Tax=Cyclopterus lumpus TaxID=8103 RepID=UPI001486975E|nr:uncharacterized protein LOC117728888 [Cyclopterus lumpus]